MGDIKDDKMPARVGHSIHENKDGSITFSYKPTEKGTHEMNLTYNDKQAEGMPFRCHVDSVGSGFVTAYGQGLNFGSSGQSCDFVVVGGKGDLAISIDGPSKADIKKKEAKDGSTHCSFVPMSPGEYAVNIKVKGKHIHGSPFSAKISGEGRKRSQLSHPATSDYPLGGANVDLTGMVGLIKTPSGGSEPCLLKKMPDGQLGIASFTPKAKGQYVVEVKQDGNAFKGSPFKISVGDGQVTSAQKVRVSGCTKEAKGQQVNDIQLDLSHAGIGALSFSIEGPHRSDLECKEESQGKYVLHYKPHEPGIYLLNVRFGDDHVTGSPFMVNVGGEPSGRVRETIEKDIKDAEVSGQGSKCEFQLKIPGTNPLDMEATLTGPSGKSELCEIRDMPQSLYDIKFVPWEEGVHTVSLKYKGLHISGSPFQYTVGKPPALGPYKVEIGGTGLEKGEVGIWNDFNVYTREAGPGRLTVSVEGPSKAELDVVDRGHGYTTCGYKVSKEGEYGIHVKYNDEHVPDSPAMVYIAPEAGDAKLVTVHGLRDRGLEPNKPAAFQVNLNNAKGQLKTYVDTPSGTEDDVFVQELDHDLYALRFLPKENGVHYVHVKLHEAHIPGSPFPMLIGKLGADPALVLARGDGLLKGTSGSPCIFTVVTTNSGSGTLMVTVEGPSKVAVQCTEVDDGYEFSYTPMAPGDYLINIKYCNVTIAGCPTKAKITGKGKPSDIIEMSTLVVETVEKKPGATAKKRFSGDAAKVKVTGNGLKKAFVNRPATFTVNVKDAGNAMLMVGVITPTGNPLEEVSYKKQRGTTYMVSFKTKEKGDHTLTVRWGSDDCPGSPYTVPVA